MLRTYILAVALAGTVIAQAPPDYVFFRTFAWRIAPMGAQPHVDPIIEVKQALGLTEREAAFLHDIARRESSASDGGKNPWDSDKRHLISTNSRILQLRMGLGPARSEKLLDYMRWTTLVPPQ